MSDSLLTTEKCCDCVSGYFEISNPGKHAHLECNKCNNNYTKPFGDIISELLRATPAAVRFISIEPMIGAVDLNKIVDGTTLGIGLDWVIVGGESGPKARPMYLTWARNVRDQCVENGVPFFFKQWGTHPMISKVNEYDILDGQQWRQFPGE